MTNEDFVSYEIAKMLKNVGFDWPCSHYYTKENASDGDVWLTTAAFSPEDWNNNRNTEPDFLKPLCSAPTLWEAQKWLREVKDCIIVIYPSADCYDCNDVVIPFLDGKWFFELWVKAERISLKETASEDYTTYESALTAGIEAALKLIEEGEG